MKLEKGTTLSHYKILSEIGKGGMGEVYLAQDTKLNRKVAIKFLSEEFSRDSENPESFSIARIYVELGEKDKAFAWLEKGFQAQSDGLTYIRNDATFKTLRDDPRFKALLAARKTK